MDNELILKWVKETGFTTPEYLGDALFRTYSGGFVAFAKLVEQHVRADEREACAKVCEEAKNHIGDPVLIGTETHYTAHTVCENLARKIRARGDQHG